ncbi:unnamed protein product [Porites lobata]|uniref:Uncharacterized protein n=1 Tax=Porites lobata TaxID=104759 RepID=A0ABN8QX28_9CNID|nr:unnamed protein product [Porites lobata]
MPDCKRKFSLNFLARFLSGQSYVASQKRDDDPDDEDGNNDELYLHDHTNTYKTESDDDNDERDRDHSLNYIKLPMDLDPLLSKSQGFLTELVSPFSV